MAEAAASKAAFLESSRGAATAAAGRTRGNQGDSRKRCQNYSASFKYITDLDHELKIKSVTLPPQVFFFIIFVDI